MRTICFLGLFVFLQDLPLRAEPDPLAVLTGAGGLKWGDSVETAKSRFSDLKLIHTGEAGLLKIQKYMMPGQYPIARWEFSFLENKLCTACAFVTLQSIQPLDKEDVQRKVGEKYYTASPLRTKLEESGVVVNVLEAENGGEIFMMYTNTVLYNELIQAAEKALEAKKAQQWERLKLGEAL